MADPELDPSVVSIDVGIRNMAWARFRAKSLQVDCGDVVSLNALIDAPQNWIEVFSACSNKLARELKAMASADQPATYVIEQQMRAHSPKCLILEAQLHAHLFPDAISIAPRSVAAFFHLGRSAVSQSTVGDEEESDGGDVFNDIKRQNKKKQAIYLVQHWITRSGDSPHALPRFSAEFKHAFAVAQKRDDIADAVLNGALFAIHSHRLFSEAVQLLDIHDVVQ